MGLIRELSISDDGSVNIVLRPSSPVCPLAFVLAAKVKEALEAMEETRCVNLRVVDFIKADEINKMMAEAYE
jgi:metal-sulfur cluster biosynthetic enzyme